MPGLLRGVARTAVIAGTATHVSNNVSRRQTSRWAEKEQAAAPPQEQYAAPPPEEDRDKQIAQLKELASLKEQGILTEEEFAAQKAEILGS